MFLCSRQFNRVRRRIVMDCQESKNCNEVCAGCEPVKLGKAWWKLRFLMRDENKEFIEAVSSLTKEKAEAMGQKGLDDYMKSLPKPKFTEVDFVATQPEPTQTSEGTFIYYRNKKRYEVTDFFSAEKIQVGLCTDKNCKDVECLKYQAELKEREARGELRIVK